MISDNEKKKIVFLTVSLFILISGISLAHDEIIDLKFGQPPVTDSELSRTLRSLVKVGSIDLEYSIPAFSQSATSSEKVSVDFKEKAFEHIENLAAIGVRAAGTENEAKAVDYIRKSFENAGLVVTSEPFEFETFVLDKMELRIGQEKTVPIRICFDPYSGFRKFSGQAIFLDPKIPPDKLLTLDLAEQIVVTAEPTNYWQVAFKNPRAVIFLKPNDFERFKGAGGQPIDMEVTGNLKMLKSANVVASIRSSSSPAKEIILSAHLDSIVGPGACDNASGIGVLIELAHHFKKMEKELPFQLNFVAFGAEEVGLVGSRIYVSRHRQDLKFCELLFNLDEVGGDKDIYVEMLGAVKGISQERGQSQIPESMTNKAGGDLEGKWSLHQIQIPSILMDASCIPDWLHEIIDISVKELGYKIIPSRGMGSDHRMFAQAGVPATGIAISGCKTHSPDDTPKQINKESLEKAGNIAASVVKKAIERFRLSSL